MAPSLRRGIALALAASVAANPLPGEQAAAKNIGIFGEVLDNPQPDPLAVKSDHCNTTIPYLPRIDLGPTFTSWTTTTTTTRYLECGACSQFTVHRLLFGVPPVARFTTTITAHSASTTSVHACSRYPASAKAEATPQAATPRPTPERQAQREASASPRFYQAPPGQDEPTVVSAPGGGAEPTCTSSTLLRPEMPQATYTVYPSTVTSTSTVDCGDCALAWSTAVLQFFAPIRYTATVSPATPSTKTDLACAAPTKAAPAYA